MGRGPAGALDIKAGGQRQGTGISGGEDAGRIDYGGAEGRGMSGPCGLLSARHCRSLAPLPRQSLSSFAPRAVNRSTSIQGMSG